MAGVLNGEIIFTADAADKTEVEKLEASLKSLQIALGLIEEAHRIEFHVHQDELVWSRVLDTLTHFDKIKSRRVKPTEFEVNVVNLLRSLSKEKDAILNMYQAKKGLMNFQSVTGKSIESVTLNEIRECSLVECIHFEEDDSFSDRMKICIDSVFPSDEVFKSIRNF